MVDIIVIGGNLAGATAAITAASEGSSVVMLEKNTQPFNPPHCGELIPESTVKSLQQENIDCKSNIITTMIFHLAEKDYCFTLKKHRFMMIDRYAVETQLLKKAEKNGVEVRLGSKMRDFHPPSEITLDDRNTLNGKIIIDASGIACTVGSKIGIDTKLQPRNIGVCIQSRVQGSFQKNTMYMWHHTPYAPFGYSWLFPISDTLANIGLGVPGGQHLDLDALLHRYIETMTNNRYTILSTFRASIPLAPPLPTLVKDNVMIIGDAARIVHPGSGGGIDHALFSGRVAGRIAAKYLQGDLSSLDLYQHAFRLKLLRLRMEHNIRAKALQSDKRFVQTYKGLFSLLHFFNTAFPGFSHETIIEKVEAFLTEGLTESRR